MQRKANGVCLVEYDRKCILREEQHKDSFLKHNEVQVMKIVGLENL
nr:MAG TPA: hypothetical protein [Caudoviricetes sp.]